MRVLVVDDEGPARRRLVRMLATLTDVEVVGEAEDGVAAQQRIATLAPELVLLDIHMPGLDGLTLAESTPMPAIVFVTAHAEHAVRAFELAAVDYLLKPFTRPRFLACLERLRARLPDEARRSLEVALQALQPAPDHWVIVSRGASRPAASTRVGWSL